MDQRLVAWARAVKSRRRPRLPVPGGTHATPRPAPPPLWLFTDPSRSAGIEAVAALPPGLAGVVFRHDGQPGRQALARAIARLCRRRRLAFVMAGPRRPLGTPPHRRAGFGPGTGGTSSAHGLADLVRARRARCALAFLSPIFPTASHPGAPALGLLPWCALARRARLPVLALGGIDGASVRRLPRGTPGIGAVGALLP